MGSGNWFGTISIASRQLEGYLDTKLIVEISKPQGFGPQALHGNDDECRWLSSACIYLQVIPVLQFCIGKQKAPPGHTNTHKQTQFET
eukprot:504946-Pelagomonas_calceolata.AAC.6